MRIARDDGSVDWLDAIPNPEKTDYGYAAFYEGISAVLMGHRTYQQVLSFDIPYPYAGKPNYVFSKQEQINRVLPEVQLVNGDIPTFVKTLKEKESGNIWLLGGGELNAYFLDKGLIDEIQIFVMPIILGKGISLFSAKSFRSRDLNLVYAKSFLSGVQELHYRFPSEPKQGHHAD